MMKKTTLLSITTALCGGCLEGSPCPWTSLHTWSSQRIIADVTRRASQYYNSDRRCRTTRGCVLLMWPSRRKMSQSRIEPPLSCPLTVQQVRSSLSLVSPALEKGCARLVVQQSVHIDFSARQISLTHAEVDSLLQQDIQLGTPL